ncbi:MAG TPA: hypothetical protein DEB43_05390 [Desulfovibrio sp.]|nr:hypothetical protein [Desulfovibrio sp.]
MIFQYPFHKQKSRYYEHFFAYSLNLLLPRCNHCNIYYLFHNKRNKKGRRRRPHKNTKRGENHSAL